jgi:GAF domain-containing protein
MFSVTDTLEEVRWPSWAKVVSDLGIRSALGVPLHARDRMIGALNLYSNEPNFFGEEEIAVAHIFGRHASVALSAATEQEGLTTAVDARNIIGQAQGILMERFDVDADSAFAALRRYSQHKNVKLRVVAQNVIEDRSFLTERE